MTSDCVVELDDDVTALTQAKSSECDSVLGTTEDTFGLTRDTIL